MIDFARRSQGFTPDYSVLWRIIEAGQEITLRDVEQFLLYRFSEVTPFNIIPVFMVINPMLKPEVYWPALRIVLHNQAASYPFRYAIRSMLTDDRPGRENMMLPDELAALHNLPETLTIHRGMTREEHESGIFGIYWTLDRSFARWFRYRQDIGDRFTLGKRKLLKTLTVPKSEIVCYTSPETTREIIYLNQAAT